MADKWVAPNGNDNNPGTKPLPYKTIQKGVDSVAALGGGTVHVELGTYVENVVMQSDVVVQGEPAPAVIEGEANQNPCDPQRPGYPVIVPALPKPIFLAEAVNDIGFRYLFLRDGRHSEMSGGGAIALLAVQDSFVDHCCIYNCRAIYGGGGIRVSSTSSGRASNFLVTHTHVWSNRSTIASGGSPRPLMSVSPGSGGGICLNEVEGATIRDSYLHDNRAHYGGAISALDCKGLSIVENERMHDNTALKEGGAISLWSCEDTKIGDGRFDENDGLSNERYTDGGGAICIEQCKAVPVSVLIYKAKFKENEAVSNGGAVAIKEHSFVRFTRCEFEENTAGDDGGGVWVFNDQSISPGTIADRVQNRELVAIDNCKFEKNDAGDDGGGLYGTGVTALEVKDCTFHGNEAANFGGGIRTSFSCHLVISDCVLDQRNEALSSSGGGIACRNATLIMQGRGRIAGNIAEGNGGGIHCSTANIDPHWDYYLYQAGFAGATVIIGGDWQIEGNVASDGNGGGISLVDNSRWTSGSYEFVSASISDIRIEGNKAPNGRGGGVYVAGLPGVSIAAVQSCDLNSAAEGGGFCFSECGDLSLRGTVSIKRNTATRSGGGLRIRDCTGQVLVVASNIFGPNAGPVATNVVVNGSPASPNVQALINQNTGLAAGDTTVLP